MAKGTENNDGKRRRDGEDRAWKKNARGRGEDHEEMHGKGQK